MWGHVLTDRKNSGNIIMFVSLQVSLSVTLFTVRSGCRLQYAMVSEIRRNIFLLTHSKEKKEIPPERWGCKSRWVVAVLMTGQL